LPRAIALELDADAGELRLALARAPSPRVLVVDPEGRPGADAIVLACPQRDEWTLVSAADGTVEFGPGAIGCIATAHHLRYSHSPPVRLTAEGRATLRLEPGGAIEGVVTDSSGRALFDAEVSVTSFDANENEQPLVGSTPEVRVSVGRDFRLSGLAPGTYVVDVFQRARHEQDDVTTLASASFEVPPGQVVRGVHIIVDTSVSEPEPVEAPNVMRLLPVAHVVDLDDVSVAEVEVPSEDVSVAEAEVTSEEDVSFAEAPR
jgi:hypothetical protein